MTMAPGGSLWVLTETDAPSRFRCAFSGTEASISKTVRDPGQKVFSFGSASHVSSQEPRNPSSYRWISYPYSCLENPMDGGAWWAVVYGIAKSWTQLSDFTFTHWRRKWQPTPVFLPGESQGRGSLVGCRLWGRTESDTTEVT